MESILKYTKKVVFLISIFFIFLFVILNVSATPSYTFPKDTDIDLKIPVVDANNAPATTATNCNITIKSPNQTIIINNQPMDWNAGGNYNISMSRQQISTKGEYHCSLYCCDATFCGFSTFTFVVGQDLSSSKSNLYIAIFIFSLIIFFLLLFFGFTIPSKNKTDEMSGYVLAVSNLKYLKLVCLGLAYVFAIFIFYLSWTLSYIYLEMDFLTEVLRLTFNVLAIATVPLFILFVYITIANLVRDSKVAEALQRGFIVEG